MPHISLLWVISCIAETNRTPFDFSEGESELVSGFNIEHGSGLFALIFIAEYGRIFFEYNFRFYFNETNVQVYYDTHNYYYASIPLNLVPYYSSTLSLWLANGPCLKSISPIFSRNTWIITFVNYHLNNLQNFCN